MSLEDYSQGRWTLGLTLGGIKSIPLIKRATGGGSRVKKLQFKGVLNQRFEKGGVLMAKDMTHRAVDESVQAINLNL